jgi:hypothetical protein
MFLGVSGSVVSVEMTQRQRQMFATLLTEVRNTRFKGNRKAAYTAAGVNSETWRRAEAGESIKEHTLTKIVASLFPRTKGDWTKMLDDDGAMVLSYWDANGLVPRPGETVEQNITQRVAENAGVDPITRWMSATAAIADLEERLSEVEARLAALEGRRPTLTVAANDEPDPIETEQGHPESP